MRALSTVLLASLVGLAGCAEPQYNYSPSVQAVSMPPLNVAQEAAVGGEMLRQGSFQVRDAIYVPELLQISMYKIAPGYFKKTGESDSGEFFLAAGGPDSGSVTQMSIADPPQALLVERGGALCVVTIFNAVTCSRPTAAVTMASAEGYERRQQTERAQGPVRTLIYAGATGNKARILYRETIAGAISDSQSTEFDLSASPKISLRGVQLEVLQATDRSIKYRVLRSFGSP